MRSRWAFSCNPGNVHSIGGVHASLHSSVYEGARGRARFSYVSLPSFLPSFLPDLVRRLRQEQALSRVDLSVSDLASLFWVSPRLAFHQLQP